MPQDETLTAATKAWMWFICSCGFQTEPVGDEQPAEAQTYKIVGHLIVAHDWTKENAMAEANAWDYTAPLKEHE